MQLSLAHHGVTVVPADASSSHQSHQQYPVVISAPLCTDTVFPPSIEPSNEPYYQTSFEEVSDSHDHMDVAISPRTPTEEEQQSSEQEERPLTDRVQAARSIAAQTQPKKKKKRKCKRRTRRDQETSPVAVSVEPTPPPAPLPLPVMEAVATPSPKLPSPKLPSPPNPEDLERERTLKRMSEIVQKVEVISKKWNIRDKPKRKEIRVFEKPVILGTQEVKKEGNKSEEQSGKVNVDVICRISDSILYDCIDEIFGEMDLALANFVDDLIEEEIGD
ncbi:hypothetical protein P9112_003632 [Eukaryota sp. TZLM1-RC]